jgi:hypothetical protein
MRLFLFVIAVFVAGTTFAGQQSGPITSLRVSSKTVSSNTSHVLLSGTNTGKPNCATLDYWAFDSDTATGKSFLATLLTAQASGRDVIVYGTNDCNLRAGMESVAEIDLAP